jgi:ketosteroid isomerase-like protein
MSTYIQAMNAHDLTTASAMITEGAVFLFSNETTHLGKAAILKAIEYNFGAIEDETFRISNLTWLVETDDVAACIYDFNWSGKFDGKPASGSGRGTALLKRDNGGWQIVNEHLSKGKFFT